MIDLNKIVRKNILSLEAYSSARDEFTGNEGIFLDANENPYNSSISFGEGLRVGLNRYPDPYQKELKTKLSQLKKINTENIFIGNGSDEVIDLAFRIFCNPGIDKALTFSPTYGMYDVSAGINAIELIKAPLTTAFQIDTSQLDNYLSDPTLKLIFTCSPNNPTGNLMNKTDIEFILNKFEGILIIDEAYIDFSSSESWIKMIDEYPNLIVSQTFSKAWGLAGARVGVAYSNKKIIELFNKVKPPYNVSELNQKAACAALDNTEEFEKNVQSILEEKERLINSFSEIDIIKKVYPSDANFLLVEVIDANKTYNKLVAQKIITRNRSNIINNCIRVSVGTPKENEQLINALKNIES